MKFLFGDSEREETTLHITLMVIGALVLQNLVLVAVLSRLVWPNAIETVRALFLAAMVIMTSPIGEPILLLAGLAALGLIAWVARRPAARGLEVVR
ncbi:MAG TPA: hypothetical protein VF720_15905 [Candidatus Eisenbacteria bacterium]